MEFPRIGLGTMGGGEQLQEAVRHAVEDCGYRHIDTAWIYGNQKDLGIALQDLFKRGVVKREELWITSKLWNHKHKPEAVEAACRETLSDLQLDYLDLYLIHHAVAFEDRGVAVPKREDGSIEIIHVPILDTWHSMEELVDKKLVRHIGVSNFSIEMLERMKYAGLKYPVFTNQVEQHLEMQQGPLCRYLTDNNIWLTAYSPLGGNSRTNKGNSPLEDPDLQEIAKRLGKSTGQVALKFLLTLSPKVAIIPKSINPKRIEENISLDFELSDEDVAKLKSKERCRRLWNEQHDWNVDIFGVGW